MSKANMSPSEEDSFERDMEGSVGSSVDSWRMELGARILKLENLLRTANASSGVAKSMRRDLAIYNSAFDLVENNPKIAASISGEKGGVQAIIKYVMNAAKQEATREELKSTIDQVKVNLPGYRLTQALGKSGGLVHNPKVNSAASSQGLPST